MEALSNVRYESSLKPWAMERADFANAYFREKGTAAYIADDFISGTGSNRVQRGLQQAKEQLAVIQANQNLQKIMPGSAPTEEVPAWAIGAYHAN
jgi:hypothetical protein